MSHTHTLRSAWTVLRFALPPLVVIVVMFGIGFSFHLRAQNVVQELLRERMLNLVSVSSALFSGEDVRILIEKGEQYDETYAKVINQLQLVRDRSPHVRFVYIMRQTEDPTMLSFVADADATLTSAQLDVNGNGVVDSDEEAALPGDAYSVQLIPALQGPAFERAIVDDEITYDQWGQVISAYAPIRDEQGITVAVLGIDIVADEFFSLARSAFSMPAVLLVTLAGALLAAYIVLMMRLRRMDMLKELDGERSALIDLAMHQLGMPLATFKWWLEILRERDNGDFCKRDGVCDQLQEGITRMDAIIGALREAGKLQSETLEYKPTRTSVDRIVRSVEKGMRHTLVLKKQKVRFNLEKNLTPVRIDRKLFAGMIRELIDNASAYSPAGTEIILDAHRTPRGVEINVTDHGCGIPSKDLPHVFEKFRRGSNASLVKPVGNGLGLYIVKRIIDKARGRIRVSSTEGAGTTFRIFLPYA